MKHYACIVTCPGSQGQCKWWTSEGLCSVLTNTFSSILTQSLLQCWESHQHNTLLISVERRASKLSWRLRSTSRGWLGVCRSVCPTQVCQRPTSSQSSVPCLYTFTGRLLSCPKPQIRWEPSLPSPFPWKSLLKGSGWILNARGREISLIMPCLM